MGHAGPFLAWHSKFCMVTLCQDLDLTLTEWTILCSSDASLLFCLHTFAHTSWLGENAVFTSISHISLVFQRWVDYSLQAESSLLRFCK